MARPRRAGLLRSGPAPRNASLARFAGLVQMFRCAGPLPAPRGTVVPVPAARVPFGGLATLRDVSVIKLVLAYDGTGFHGWARQRGGLRTVQGVLEEALQRVLREVPVLSVAGRTDAGVHARGQVVSFGSDADPARIQRSVNRMLAPEVVV